MNQIILYHLILNTSCLILSSQLILLSQLRHQNIAQPSKFMNKHFPSGELVCVMFQILDALVYFCLFFRNIIKLHEWLSVYKLSPTNSNKWNCLQYNMVQKFLDDYWAIYPNGNLLNKYYHWSMFLPLDVAMIMQKNIGEQKLLPIVFYGRVYNLPASYVFCNHSCYRHIHTWQNLD